MDIQQMIQTHLEAHLELAQRMHELEDELALAVELVVETFRRGNKLLLAGNGGSAADAQHWAAEWSIRLSPDVKRPSLPAISLTTDSSILTAGANDLGFDEVFARQIEGLGRDGDLLIVISTSGNSPNLLRATATAHAQDMRVLGVLGKSGGELKAHCDLALVVPSDDTQRIQEMHSFIGHILCELSERELYGA